ncbi:uncharacterized protein LOC142831022 [Pelodiscus sinensis]|uniref:uncharacterized protein LOC142831022 n=1 Tax=Pelodiscus sinensis TaxID=13735 RepID=UPI003F6A5ED1
MPSPLSVPHTSLTCPDLGISPPPLYVSQITKEKTKWKGKYKSKKLNKDDISYPCNFRHLSHWGWTQPTGFAAILNSDLKKLFDQAGVTEDHLKNKRTSEKIFKMIERKGGIEAIRKEALRATSSRSSSALLHSTSSSTISPSIELTSSSSQRADGLKSIQLASPSTSNALYPPWNVPSIVIAPALPVLPPLSPKRTSPVDLQRQSLHKIKTEKTPTTLHQNDLMGQIRKGIQLKSVTPTSPQSPSDGGIVAALRDVIQKRHKDLYSSGEETESENEEWKD